MKTDNALSKIKKTNKYWLSWVYIATPIAFICTLANIILQNRFPEKFENYNIGYNLIILIFVLLITLLYYIQYKIFDFHLAHVNLKTALEKATSRFKDFYKLSTGIYSILFPFTFFVIIDMMSTLNFGFSLLISLLLSAVSLWGNHIYYKKTYFTWIQNMENHLAELNEN